MSKEKQIEEMIKELCVDYGTKCGVCGCKPCAFIEHCKVLYNAGYRKQIEGEWLTKGGFFMEHICSVCGYSVDYLYQRTPFCPECGAKMKGGTEQ